MDVTGTRITPSKPDLWTGTPSSSGTKLTLEQIEWMAKPKVRARADRNRRRFQLPYVYPHRLRVPGKYMGSAFYAPDTFTVVPCPVIGCTKDGKRLCIVTPAGIEHYVDWKK